MAKSIKLARVKDKGKRVPHVRAVGKSLCCCAYAVDEAGIKKAATSSGYASFKATLQESYPLLKERASAQKS